jgi:hypothetical protein
MLVIALCYSLYNLKNLERGRYGLLCMASARIACGRTADEHCTQDGKRNQRIYTDRRERRLGLSSIVRTIANALPAPQRHARCFQTALSGLRRRLSDSRIYVRITSLFS